MKYISIISKLFLCLAFSVMVGACKDDENRTDNSALTLLSCTPGQGENVSTEGTIELTFSKSVRQAPDTEITVNGSAIRIIITDNVVRVHYSEPLADHLTLDIPSGALTDMDGVQKYEGLNLTYEIKLEKRLFDAVVDCNGNGDYTTISEAIEKAPSSSEQPYLIFVANGAYDEALIITKPYIHLIGQDVEKTKIQKLMCRVKWDGSGSQPVGWDYSSQNSAFADANGLTSSNEAVVLVKSNDFHAENISFINLYGARTAEYGGMFGDGQADALMTRADRISFYNCKAVSFQDTWWVRNNESDNWKGLNNRNYADNCWIEGKTDYLYGNGNLLVENSTFYNVYSSGNVMTAGSHYEGTTWGHIMRDCIVDGVPEANDNTYFGRPWQNQPIAIWINTTCKVKIADAGYMDMSVSPYLYAEYNTVDANGNAVDTSKRKSSFTVGGVSVPYEKSLVLTETEAANYTYDNVVKGDDGWDPKSYYTTEKLPAVENVSIYGTTLSWDGQNKAICYLIFEDGVYVGQTTETSYEVNANGGTYTVKSVNKYGCLSD